MMETVLILYICKHWQIESCMCVRSYFRQHTLNAARRCAFSKVLCSILLSTTREYRSYCIGLSTTVPHIVSHSFYGNVCGKWKWHWDWKVNRNFTDLCTKSVEGPKPIPYVSNVNCRLTVFLSRFDPYNYVTRMK
jgi:hypothetical protein